MQPMFKQLRVLASLLVLALVAPLASAGPLDGNSSEVMLQGFHWHSHQTYPWWNVIKNNASTIRGAGFDMIWLPPASDAASDEGYLPRRLELFTSKYGNETDLRAALSALNTAGV